MFVYQSRSHQLSSNHNIVCSILFSKAPTHSPIESSRPIMQDSPFISTLSAGLLYADPSVATEMQTAMTCRNYTASKLHRHRIHWKCLGSFCYTPQFKHHKRVPMPRKILTASSSAPISQLFRDHVHSIGLGLTRMSKAKSRGPVHSHFHLSMSEVWRTTP